MEKLLHLAVLVAAALFVVHLWHQHENRATRGTKHANGCPVLDNQELY